MEQKNYLEDKYQLEKRIEEIDRKTIAIRKANYRDFFSLDIVAFSFAMGGAMGAGGEVRMITSDGKIYSTNYVYSDMTLDEVILVCPPLNDCRLGLFEAEVVPEGWTYFNLGCGNNLFVKDPMSQNVKDTGFEGVDLYQLWDIIVLDALDKNGSHK